MLNRLPAYLALLAGVVAFAGSARADDEPKTYEVKTIKDVTYYEGDDADKVKHKLDLYLPRDKEDFPVFFFVHGGAWVHGDKNFLNLYSSLGTYFAKHGVGVVVTNYRLSPGVKHPEHVKDVARAFAWTYKNIEKYGGRPDQIFACGHSAGGHLVSLLATDETYLKAEGLSAKDVQGVVSISGVYRVDAFDLRLSAKNEWLDIGAEVHPLASVFGEDPEVLKQASPLTHVRPGLPPFLLIYGGLDYCPIQRMTREFETALEDNDCEVDVKKVPWRTHETVLVDLVHGVEPATADALIRFVERHSRDAAKPEFGPQMNSP